MDGPAYHPCVAIISLGSPCCFRFERSSLERASDGAEGGGEYLDGSDTGTPGMERLPPEFFRAELLLQPGSLIVFSGPAYSELLHSVPEATADTVGGGGDDGRAPACPCINAAEAGVSPGHVVLRSRRVSLTLRYVPPAAAVL